jgi:hypothetical protein
MFSLDSVIYTLPVHFSELEARGWTPYDHYNGFATTTLEPGDFFSWELISKEQNVGVTFTNLSEEVLPISESHITAVIALYEVYNAQIVLPRNIMLGSTSEDVYSAYGNPNSGDTSEDHALLFYSSDSFTLQLLINAEINMVAMTSLHFWSGR